jgi:hypothetical protein
MRARPCCGRLPPSSSTTTALPASSRPVLRVAALAAVLAALLRQRAGVYHVAGPAAWIYYCCFLSKICLSSFCPCIYRFPLFTAIVSKG